jgi:repressor LexA
LFVGNELYALRVEGHSMRDAGILNGDIAIINRQEDVVDGQIAAVLLGDSDTTLKRFYREDGAIVLRAANPDFKDIIVTPQDGVSVTIAGRLVGVLRTRYFAAA